ncbi:MAG: hypothetical protein J6P65_08850 [Bacteroidales bacterium]|nr:hypothetical protein [Bacteroidales bacterium]
MTNRRIPEPDHVDENVSANVVKTIQNYHTCRSLESGTVIIEFKNTKYTPAGTEEL